MLKIFQSQVSYLFQFNLKFYVHLWWGMKGMKEFLWTRRIKFWSSMMCYNNGNLKWYHEIICYISFQQ